MNLSKPSIFWKSRHAGRNAVLFLFSTVVLAQGMSNPIKQGLWQTQTTETIQMSLPPEVEARIAAMPAAQQAQMRGMMAGGGAKPQTTTVKSCVAKITSPDDLMNQAQQKSGTKCTFTNRQETGSTLSFDMNCSMQQGTATGHYSFVLKDSDHATGTFHMTSAMSAHGSTSSAAIDGTATYTYLGADCGDVKPGSAQ